MRTSHLLALTIAIGGCRAATTPTAASPRGDPPAPRDVAPSASAASIATVEDAGAPAPAPRETCLALTRRLPALAAKLRGTDQDRTFMLAPEDTAHLDVAPLGAAPAGDLSAMKSAFERMMRPRIGDDPPSFEVKIAARGATGYTFDVQGRTEDFATCHGEYETFGWHGSFDVAAGQVTAFTLTGTGKVTEDVCSATNGGATRDVVGRWAATYAGALSHACGEAND